jgi:NAD(P)-dependent dehydrogenase (short-subunit alcohol dehydrogenase family)
MSNTSRTVVITGASRGLGLALTECHVAAGDHVFAGCRRPADAPALRALENVTVLPLDVTDEESIRRFGDAVATSTDHVDVLLNNAGANATAFGGDAAHSGVLELDPSHFRAQMEVNAIGPMLVARSLLDLLRASPAGRIVNISSQLGSLALGAQMLRDIGYNASKAALNMVTAALAGTLGPEGIVAVAIHPGWVRTDMGGDAAPLSAKDSAAALLQTVRTLTAADNGCFLKWDGSRHPW